MDSVCFIGVPAATSGYNDKIVPVCLAPAIHALPDRWKGGLFSGPVHL
jgi:hypothetical protein